MATRSWNRQFWDGDYNWAAAGEEWSATWGNSAAQWLGMLFPRLAHFLPAQRILEIAPGYGRWTQYLLGQCDELVGVDISAECVAHCTQRFGEQAKFIKNDGLSLAEVDGPFDFVFSFDSLVHADQEVLDAYIPQILAKLSPRGVAFIHHANWAASGSPTNIGNRSFDVTAATIAQSVAKFGGGVLRQETINWENEHLTDCMTLFARSVSGPPPAPFANPDFIKEATMIRDSIAPYVSLPRLLR